MSGTAEVSAAYRQAEKSMKELDAVLEAFASQKAGQSQIAMEQQLSVLWRNFTQEVQKVEDEVASLPAQNRATWTRRSSNLKDDLNSRQRDVDKYLGPMFAKQKEAEDREALLGGRGANKKTDDETTEMLKEHRGLREASNALDEVLESGKGILDSLVGQNKILKGARKKLLDAANVMGVSNSLVKVIDRRQTGDKYLVYGGMAFVLFLLLSLFYLLRM
jgi:Golgi SNAP receptor complex protein 2